jgi:hypothetical protein
MGTEDEFMQQDATGTCATRGEIVESPEAMLEHERLEHGDDLAPELPGRTEGNAWSPVSDPTWRLARGAARATGGAAS